MIQIILYALGFPIIMASQYLIEHFGRRPVLILSGLCMSASLMIVGALGVSSDPTYPMKQAIVAMVFIYMIFFNLGWGPAVWVVTSELCTGRNRTKLMSMSTGTNWLFTWLVSFTFPYLFNPDAAGLGAKIGFIYGSLMLCASAWVYFLLPETAQRSLEEIDEMFEKQVPAREFSSKSQLLAFSHCYRQALKSQLTRYSKLMYANV